MHLQVLDSKEQSERYKGNEITEESLFRQI
jgi:hypothetical protein